MEILLHPDFKIFSHIAGFMVVFLAFEICLLLVGMSSDFDLGDVDAGLDAGGFDADVFDAAEIDLSPQEMGMLDINPEGEFYTPRTPMQKFLSLIGITRGPLMIWLSAIAAGVSGCGFALQAVMNSIFGSGLPPSAALLIVAVPGVLIGGELTRWASRIIPPIESHSITSEGYRNRRGVIIDTPAGPGRPGFVLWHDIHGHSHRTLFLPLRENEVFAEGDEVLLVRTKERQPRMIKI